MPKAMPRFSSCAKMAGFIDTLLPMICGMALMDSVPAPIMMSASPVRMRAAASATACRPEAQKRLTVTPATLCGSPASSSPMRATFMPCSASGMAQPAITSSMRAGSSPGACASAPFSAAASMSSGRVVA